MVASTSDADVSIHLGLAGGGFSAPTPFAAGRNSVTVAIGDFDADGQADLAVGNLSSRDISVLLGRGDGSFDPPVNFGTRASNGSVAVGDFDNDGDPDLAASNFSRTTVAVLLNSPQPTPVIPESGAAVLLPLVGAAVVVAAMTRHRLATR